ncbi:MAG: D-alanyl-D-alanine carboxypeptidase, partial [Gammaproteobacteria bacterium]|nr:D-alanyl-D-alanine carboxypeptidase [Gammaproteobacteria bacterium]
MKRVNTFLSITALLLGCLLGALPSFAAEPPRAPSLEATSWRLEDFHTGQVLAESNSDVQVEPASMTKLMTTYVVFSEIRAGRVRLDDKVRVSENAWRMPGSRMFIEVDSEVTVDQLLHGVIVQSGNDA